MIKELHLKNFKGFKDHVVEFRSFSVVVGHNNAGKSSAFEALRIIATAAKKFATHKYVNSPSWAADYGKGISPSLDEVNLKPETIFYKYSYPPAVIRAVFENGAEISVFLGDQDQIHARALTPEEREVETKALAKKCEFTPISILPQISPLRDTETVLRRPYVQKCIETQLSSRHFRNQIRYLYEHFEDFRDLFQRTWEGIRIAEFNDPKASYEDELFLMLGEDGFVAEVSNFGHGLQMWLQIVWFLARTNSQSIVIMDEPDVYMHPQQQQRMVDLLRQRFSQCVLSTHAPGILEHCDEEDILRLHRKIERSSCSLGAIEYETELAEADALERSNGEAVGTSKTVEMKVVVYERGSLRVYDDSDDVIVDVREQWDPKDPTDIGEYEAYKAVFTVDLHGVCRFEVVNSDDISIFFDGESLVLEELIPNRKTSGVFEITPAKCINPDTPR